MSVLKRTEIVEHLIETLDLTESDAQAIIDSFFEEIKKSLENNQPVKLSGFGNFVLRNMHQRKVRHPKTGEEILIEPRRFVRFKSGKKLKARVRNRLMKTT